MFEQMLAQLEQSPMTPHADTVSSVAVIGAGPVGQSIACAALAGGTEVTLHSAFGEETRKLTDAGAIEVDGGSLAGSYAFVAGDARRRSQGIRVVPELDIAIRGADVVVLAVPASAHATYAALLAPVLRSGQMIVLAPGRSMGALEVARGLRRQRPSEDVTVVELCSAPYLVTSRHPGQLTIEAEHQRVLGAALSNAATQGAVSVLRTLFPAVEPAAGVLHTSFANMAGLLVAVPALLSASAPGPATVRERLPAALVESVISRVDAERRRTAFAFGVRELASFHQWLEVALGTTEKDTVTALDEVTAFSRLRAPVVGEAEVRDAVSTCLVPIASAAAIANVPTPATASLIALASAIDGFDHARHGRTMAALGLDRMRPDEIRRALDGADNALAQEVLA
ncbi:NAD/NADP octopine/nopaline dehydrogenase family protein [Nocardioides sp. NPDC006303]|uniref:NAD/NADP octopine/nopaline dehydrogenase family protein n=1 Tax=Nocardioides sp. NPDC006303 TaxID=3156747 RepID=UPI0033B25921